MPWGRDVQSPGDPSRFTPPPAGSYGAANVPMRPAKQSGYAVAALVCGLTPLLSGCFPVGFVAIYLGMKARALAQQQPDKYEGEGMALAGMILGSVFGVGYMLFWLLYALFFAGMFAGVWAGFP